MEQVNMLLEPVRIFLIQLGEFLPKLLLAIIITVAGWLIAKAIRLAVVKGLKSVNFHVLTERAGMDRFLQQGGMKTDTSHILADLIYWLVILAALVLAFNSLGLAHVTDLLGRIMLFVPRLILAVVILAFGSYFAHFIENLVTAYGKSVDLTDAELLGRLARTAIIVFVVLIALDQLNIGGDIVRQSFLIILAGVVLALALAFGIAGRKWATALLQRWWPNPDKDVQSIDDKE
ncbi:MAG: mechanosensitive ion channel family protein [Burkholderiaceae bacterium]